MAIRKGTTKQKGRRGAYTREVPVPCRLCFHPLDDRGFCAACRRRRRAGL